MAEIFTTKSTDRILAVLGDYVGPRKYWLHNEIGGEDWAIKTVSGGRIIILPDEQLATFITLKLC